MTFGTDYLEVVLVFLAVTEFKTGQSQYGYHLKIL
jgi:hypothetical protein